MDQLDVRPCYDFVTRFSGNFLDLFSFLFIVYFSYELFTDDYFEIPSLFVETNVNHSMLCSDGIRYFLSTKKP